MVATIFTVPPGAFALFFFSLSLSVLPTQVFLYVFTRRPFADSIDNVQAVAGEGGTVVVSVLVSVYTFDVGEEVKAAIDVAGVWTVRLILISSSILSVIKVGLQMAKTLLKYKQTVKALAGAAAHP